MPLFVVAQAGSRTDNIVVESISKSKILTFFSAVSESIVRNIKLIVYSKDYNINYTAVPFVETSVYKKVIVTALSQNYTEIYTLFNIKKSVTKQQITTQFKKLHIKDEPITDIANILLYDEGDLSPFDSNNLYQIQYKRFDKTYVENFHASSWQKIKDVAQTLIDGEITEIRKFVHSDPTVKKTKINNVYKGISVTIQDNDSYQNFKITNVKHSILNDVFINHLTIAFKLNNLSINSGNISLKYR